ncbi:cell division cycle protein 27 homolog isoform X2 [Zootermopsis nevadensis]|uniref:cell division cycle protein 27 homolog isoform X2 n=1 Tax=Zootermopsis nevadensis TaxID=136037 RepID=UPI000B8E8F14|nr:cell division cycle protein 27 homolog isoform X2 [Zootermopsis nevadensis]
MIIQEPVQAAIWHCLNHYAYPDAIFLAERLYAEVDSDDALFLLATCYYRSGKPGQAYSILRNKATSSAQCKYLLAKCCLDLHKFSEAESVLTGGDTARSRSFDELVSEFGDQACFALQILARICSQSERCSKAAEACVKALKLNPFLWNSFEELCNRGEKPDPFRTFQVSHLENFTMCHGNNPMVNFVNNFEHNSCNNITNSSATNNEATVLNTISSTPVQLLNCFNTAPSSVRVFTPEESPLANPLNAGHSSIAPLPSPRGKPLRFRSIFSGGISPLTPSFGVLPLDSPSFCDSLQMAYLSPTLVPSTTLTEANDQKSLAKRQLISRKETPLQQSKPVFSQSGNTSNTSNIVPTSSPTTPQAPLQPGSVRRSSRLFSNSYSVKENNKSPNRNKFAAPKSPSGKTKSRISKTNRNKTNFNELNERNRSEKEKTETITSSDLKIISNNGGSVHSAIQQALQMQKQSSEGLMALLRELGTAYLHLSQFNCRKAIDCLNNLPPHHYNTGWVLSLLGKAHYELTEYQQAVRYFSEVREREPYRCQLMELYSTALWHLQKEVALSALAQDLLAHDRLSPAAWCATGNCFSLQKEHDSAIKFFQRAVQVDPTFAYAYTLLGHEYVTTEELDKAMSCFRSAVRIDSRHFNAWYGIGTIYSKQERYLLAEIHFKRALSINTQSSVLLCHIGVVQHALQKTEKALQTLNIAIANDPKNPLCKFHRASIYFAAGRHAEALKELEELKEIVPKESLVYYLTGKVHKKLGNTHLALMHFSWATDLDPKGANSQIKEAIDPAMSRSQAEEDTSTTHPGEDYPSEGSSVPQHESSQEGAEFVSMRDESDESL